MTTNCCCCCRRRRSHPVLYGLTTEFTFGVLKYATMVVVRVVYTKPRSEIEWVIELSEELEYVAACQEAIRMVSQHTELPEKEFTVLRIINTNDWRFLKPFEKLGGSEHRVIVRRTVCSFAYATFHC